MVFRPIQFTEFGQSIDAHYLAEHLGALVTDFPRCFNSRESLLQSTLYCVEKIPAETQHGYVGDFDPAEAMLPAQLNAAVEIIVSGDHPPARVLGVGHTAQRADFGFRRFRLSSEFQRPLVLLAAVIDLAKREVKIASNIVDSGQFQCQAAIGGVALTISPGLSPDSSGKESASWRRACLIE